MGCCCFLSFLSITIVQFPHHAELYLGLFGLGLMWLNAMDEHSAEDGSLLQQPNDRPRAKRINP